MPRDGDLAHQQLHTHALPKLRPPMDAGAYLSYQRYKTLFQVSLLVDGHSHTDHWRLTLSKRNDSLHRHAHTHGLSKKEGWQKNVQWAQRGGRMPAKGPDLPLANYLGRYNTS